jgi:hypothetical protein
LTRKPVNEETRQRSFGLLGRPNLQIDKVSANGRLQKWPIGHRRASQPPNSGQAGGRSGRDRDQRCIYGALGGDCRAPPRPFWARSDASVRPQGGLMPPRLSRRHSNTRLPRLSRPCQNQGKPRESLSCSLDRATPVCMVWRPYELAPDRATLAFGIARDCRSDGQPERPKIRSPKPPPERMSPPNVA